MKTLVTLLVQTSQGGELLASAGVDFNQSVAQTPSFEVFWDNNNGIDGVSRRTELFQLFDSIFLPLIKTLAETAFVDAYGLHPRPSVGIVPADVNDSGSVHVNTSENCQDANLSATQSGVESDATLKSEEVQA